MDELAEVFTCSCCGEEFSEDELRDFNGELWCDSCLDEQTFICARCDGRFHNDDNAGDGDTPLCDSCYDRGDYTRCERCNCVIHYDETYYEEDDEDHDCPYCSSCYNYQGEGRYLHDYGYKSEPVFHGDGSRFFGVELEIDEGGKSNKNARSLTNLANKNCNHIYIKSDGSLDDGMEIVTHPMTLEYHTNSMPWAELLDEALCMDYRSHKTDTCGLHIHVNRNSFGENIKQQEDCIGRILFIVERFWQELLRFSRRTESQIKQWANRYGYKERPCEILDHAKKGNLGRYMAVNITNYHTIEFRMFRGTLKLNTVIATLQLVNEICNVAFSMSDIEVGSLDWCGFVERIGSAELITYLKERRLYINEPVESEDDE